LDFQTLIRIPNKTYMIVCFVFVSGFRFFTFDFNFVFGREAACPSGFCQVSFCVFFFQVSFGFSMVMRFFKSLGSSSAFDFLQILLFQTGFQIDKGVFWSSFILSFGFPNFDFFRGK